MKDILSKNIVDYRKKRGFTQEEMANHLGITFQAVSKWETGQTMPDITLLPQIADMLEVSIEKLLGYSSKVSNLSYYEDAYNKEKYFWGLEPSYMCLKILEYMPPIRPLKLLDVGCGEGKDAVFLARCGYQVSAFDISDAGLEKLKRLSDHAKVSVRAFKADIWEFRLDEKYDIIYSSGALHYIKPELRKEIVENYKQNISKDGIVALHVFVDKPFILPPPEKEMNSHMWKSGQLFTYFHDWYFQFCDEEIFDCNSSGILHQHAANRLIAKNICSKKALLID